MRKLPQALHLGMLATTCFYSIIADTLLTGLLHEHHLPSLHQAFYDPGTVYLHYADVYVLRHGPGDIAE